MHTKLFRQNIGSISRRGNAMGWDMPVSVCLATDAGPNTAAVCVTQQFLAVQRSSSSDG